MSFQDLAHATEDVASSLTSFVSKVPEHATDITSVVSELFAISTALRSLEASHAVPALRCNFSKIVEDVELVVRASLRVTVRDLLEGLARVNVNVNANVSASVHAGVSVGAGGDADPAVHRATWISLWTYFQRQAGFSLHLRLKYYRAMLGEMAAIARGEAANQFVLERHRDAISLLRITQDRQRAAAAAAAENRRQTPVSPTHQPQPHVYVQTPADTVPNHRNHTPLKSAMRKPHLSHYPWEALDAHHTSAQPSPTFASRPESREDSSSLNTLGSLSSPTESSASAATAPAAILDDSDHWGAKAFHPPSVSTPLSRTGPPTRCFGEHMPSAKAMLREEYDKLFQLDFPGPPPMSISFHLRSSDHRTRILCAIYGSKKSHTQYTTLPITSLAIAREGSCLQLFQKSPQGKGVEVWATLQFRSIERLAAFHCAFLALRGQDASTPVGNIKDAELKGEIQIYKGQIIDDDFLHVLRVFRDSDSKAVRLIASVHEGELDRVPVWSAFVHRHMRSSSWMRKMGPRILYLSKLQRTLYIDSSEYQPEITAEGYHVITFASELDLDSFLSCVDNLLIHTRTF